MLGVFKDSGSEQPANNITININKDGEATTSSTTEVKQENPTTNAAPVTGTVTNDSPSTNTPKSTTTDTTTSDGNYKKFNDSKYGFSFDYPIEMDDVNNVGEGAYKINLPTSTISTGVSFDLSNIDEVKNSMYLADAKNFEVKDLGNNSYLLTWVRPVLSIGYIQKDFFIQDAFGNSQRQYIRYEYNANTSATEKATAQHIIDSFTPGN